jgi:hypothetical protein
MKNCKLCGTIVANNYMSTTTIKAFTATEVFVKSWQMVKQHWAKYLLIFFAVISIVIGSMIIDGVLKALGIPWIVNSIITVLFSVYISIVTAKGALSVARSQKVNLPELLTIDSKMFGRAVLAGILLQILVLVGLVFLIVPGIILGLMYGYSLMSIIDAKTTLFASFTDSSQLTKGHLLEIFIFQVLLGFTALGLIAVPVIIFSVTMVGAEGSTMSAIVPVVLLAIVTICVVVGALAVLAAMGLAGQAYMYLKMREHSPAPKV